MAALLALTGLRVAAHLGFSAPFLVLLLLLYQWQLGRFEPYFVVNERPPELWGFLAMALPLVVGLLAGNAVLYVRSVFAAPILLLQDQGAWSALKASAALSRDRRWRIALTLLPVAAGIVLLPVLATIVTDWTVVPLLGLLPERNAILIPATLLVVTLAILTAISLSFVGIAVNGLVVHALYRQLPDAKSAWRPCHPKGRP